MAWPNAYNLDSSSFDNSAARQPSRPTIVLVHEAFHNNAHFTPLMRELQQASYRVLLPQLPSSNATFRANVFEADVQSIHDCAKPEIEASRNIVLVLHGYSGIPGPVAAERLNRYALGRPRTGFVVKILLVAAIIAREGECYLDVLNPEWLIYENGLLGVRRPQEIFYQDCSVESTRTAVGMLRPQIADSFRTRTVSAGWIHIPCVYVVCGLDNAIHPTAQRAFVSKLQASNRQVAVVGVQAGHSPHISRTQDTAAMIVHAITSS